ncbi:MAG: tetratricopeptide repeat protein [Myxococcota bacterium]|nr:tetratricopeptide repeat protein [Myxococcota bacterium]
MLQRAGIALALAIATAAVYAPLASHDFVRLDDVRVVTGNPALEFDGFFDAASKALEPNVANWIPVTLMSLQLDRALWEGAPAGSLLGNLALHIAATLALFGALQRLTGAVWPSAFVAAVFALHPLHVESVAWAAMRKDSLSGLFWMLALWGYAAYAEQPRRARYAAVTLWIVLGLLSKPTVVTLPFVLLLLDWWPLERLQHAATRRRALVEKLPWFALAAGASVVTWVVQDQWHAITDLSEIPLGQRLANAVDAWRLYVQKGFWPADLAVYYPHPRESLTWPRIAISGGVLAVASGLCLALARKRPYLIVGWLWYVGTLVPVIGIVQVGNQASADRYSYLPLIGLSIAITWAVRDLLARHPRARMGAGLAALALLTAMSITTRRQLDHWQNEIALQSQAVAVSPADPLSRHRLAAALRQAGQTEAAILHLERAVALAPEHGWAYVELADLLSRNDANERAIELYEQAIALSPRLDRAHVNLGLALSRLDRLTEARPHLERGLALHAAAPRNSELSPDALAAPHQALADALTAAGELDAAIGHYQSALAIEPGRSRARSNLGLALADAGRFEQALPLLEDSLAVDYRSAKVQAGLARTYARLERPHDAVRHFRNALLLRPRWRPATNDLAWILATSPDPELRRPGEAVAMLEAVLLADETQPAMLDTLGVAYAADGRFEDAVRATDRALTLVKNDVEFTQQLLDRRALYRAGVAFSEHPNRVPGSGADDAVR